MFDLLSHRPFWSPIGLSLLLGVALVGGALVWPSNRASLAALQQLQGRAPLAPRVGSSSLTPGNPPCLPYPELFADIQAIRQSSPALALQRLQQADSCPYGSKAILLKPVAGEILASLGRYTESCDVFASVNAKTGLMSQANHSFEQRDWPALAVYLHCLDRVRDQPAWFSPNQVATLYFELGKHEQLAGRTEEAIAAYTGSSAWYPGIWSPPELARAGLLAGTGRRHEAIQLLQHAVAQAADPVTVIFLLRGLGDLWEAEGGLEYTYCAYHKAERLTYGLTQTLPPDRGFEGLRVELAAHLEGLPNTSIPTDLDCNVLLPKRLLVR